MGIQKINELRQLLISPPGSEKIGPKYTKNKKINTSTANHKQKKTTKPSTNKEETTERTPRRPLMMRCTVPPGQSLYPQAKKVACSLRAGRLNANGLGPAARVPPRVLPGASVGAENRGSSPTSCPACTPRPFYLLH